MKRNINSEGHRKFFGKRQCWVCGDKIEGRRRHYCSSKCGAEMQRLVDSTSWNLVKEKALERDGRKCVLCGNGVGCIEEEEKRLSLDLDRLDGKVMMELKTGKNWYEIPEERERLKILGHIDFINSHMIVVDHKLPIAMGGNCFCLENLQTLCWKCHKRKTFLDLKTMKYYRRCKNEEQRKEQANAHMMTLKTMGLVKYGT